MSTDSSLMTSTSSSSSSSSSSSIVSAASAAASALVDIGEMIQTGQVDNPQDQQVVVVNYIRQMMSRLEAMEKKAEESKDSLDKRLTTVLKTVYDMNDDMKEEIKKEK